MFSEVHTKCLVFTVWMETLMGLAHTLTHSLTQMHSYTPQDTHTHSILIMFLYECLYFFPFPFRHESPAIQLNNPARSPGDSTNPPPLYEECISAYVNTDINMQQKAPEAANVGPM